MACSTTPANPLAVAYNVDCCRFQLLDDSGGILCEVNLFDTVIKKSGSGALILNDNIGSRPFTEGDATNLGFANLAAFENYIVAERQECCEGGNQSDELKLICVEENANLYILDVSQTPPTIKDFQGNDVTNSVTPTVCQDLTFNTKDVDFCVDGQDFTRVDCIKKDKSGNVIGTDSFWQDVNGVTVPNPSDSAASVIKGSCAITCAEVGSLGTITDWSALKK